MSDEATTETEQRSQAFEYRIGDDESVIEAVLHAVGAVTDTPVGPGPDERDASDEARESAPPLHDVIDPDALTRLASESSDGAEVQVAFSYVGCAVTVIGSDGVLVDEPSSSTDSTD